MLSKTKIAVVDRKKGVNDCKLYIKGKQLEYIDGFVYLNKMFTKDEKMDEVILKGANVVE